MVECGMVLEHGMWEARGYINVKHNTGILNIHTENYCWYTSYILQPQC